MEANLAGPRLYLEPLGPPAQQRLSRLIGEAKVGDSLDPLTVVVPSPYAGLALRRSLAADAGLVNVRFIVLPRLAEILGSPSLAERGKAPLNSLIETAAIRSACAQLSGQGPIVEVAHPKLHQALRGTFSELDKLCEDDLDKLAAADPLRRQIILWYRLTRRKLQDYYNREELYWAATCAVADGRAQSSLRDLGWIFFYLIRGLSPGENELVRVLGEKGISATIMGVAFEPDVDAHTYKTAERLQPALGSAAVVAPPQVKPCADHLLSAPDAQEEVRWVLRHLAKEAEAGMPFHRIAVLYRQSDPYASLVPSQLRLARIPVAGPDPRRLKETPPGKLLLGLLKVFAEDFSREAVMHWLVEAPVRTGTGQTAESAELARWEIISRQAGVIKGLPQWQERVRGCSANMQLKLNTLTATGEASEPRIRELETQISSADRLVRFLGGLASSSPPSQATWSEFVRWGEELLRRYTFDVEHWPAGHADAYDRVEKRLDELSALDEVMPSADFADFRLILEQALEVPAGRTGATGSGVFVASVAAAQGMEFDTVYLLGMAEGSFPPAPPIDPLLPEPIREQVGVAASLPLQRTRSVEERWLYLAALAAGKTRILCYPRTDSRARRGQYPSVWFLEEASRLSGKQLESGDIGRLRAQSWLTVIESPEDAFKLASFVGPADVYDYDMASLSRWRQSGKELAQHPLAAAGLPLGRASRLERARQGQAFTEWDGSVAAMAGGCRRLSLPASGVYSPTRLENWAKCPFSYFLSHVLGLSVLESPEDIESISAMDRGSLIHSALEKLFRVCMETGRLPDYGQPWEPWHLQKLMEIAESEFRAAEARGITGKLLLWQVAQEEIRQDLMAFLDADGKMRAETNLRPASVEQRFGFGENALPAVQVRLSDGPVLRFRGIIDRIDSDRSGRTILVTDYKSGSNYPFRDMDTEPLGYGRHLQLPIYALAAQPEGGNEAEVTAQYWFITARGRFERKLIRLTEQKHRFLEIVGAIVGGIQSGVFPANPGSAGRDGPENCQFCDFDRVCPSNRDLSWDRKAGDRALAPYTSLLAGQMAVGEK